MPDGKPDFKVTKFDSSVATLERINGLIEMSHRCYLAWNSGIEEEKLGVIETRFTYLRVNDCIYTEVFESLTEDERTQCGVHITKTNKLLDEYSVELHRPHKKKNKGLSGSFGGFNVVSNEKYGNGWFKLKSLGRDYFLFLLGCLDRHGMLMKKKKTGDEEDEM